MTKVMLSNDNPQRVVIRRITPKYQYLWFRFYCPSLFPGGDSRAHVHDAFGDGGSIDYRRRRKNEGLVRVLEALLGRCPERLMRM
jgi:hypothetical protein